MKDLICFSLYFYIFSLCSVRLGFTSSSVSKNPEISSIDLRSKLDTMLINALKAYTYVPNSGIGSREVKQCFDFINLFTELRLHDIVKDDETFDYFSKVQQWYSFSSLERVYLLGLTNQPGLVASILDQNKDRNIKNSNSHVVIISSSSIVLPFRVLNAAIFQWWNSTSKEMDTIFVVALDNPEVELKWYHFVERKLVEFWSWSIHKPVNNMQIFTYERYIKLVLVNAAPVNSIDMYDINLGRSKPDFSLSQIMHFESAVQSVAISSVGESIYLSVVQPHLDIISVFKLDSAMMVYSQFHFHSNLTCKAVKDVTAFNTAYQSYLAVAGDETTIYLIKFNGEIVKELKTNLGSVDKWAAVKLATFRDDVLLMALNSGAHDIHFLGWRGTEKGFAQLTGSELFCTESEVKGAMQEFCSISKRSWEGSTSFLLGGIGSAVACFLVPNPDGSSSLFRFNTSFNPIASPIIWELDVLNSKRNFIQDRLEEQKDKLSQFEEKLRNSLKANATNIIKGAWKVNHLSTPCLDKGNSFLVGEEIDLNNNSKSGIASLNDKLEQIVENYREAVDFVKDENRMKKAILESKTVMHRVTARSKTVINSAKIETTLNGLLVENLLNGTFRIDRPQRITGVTTVRSLEANNLEIQKVKNINFEELMFAGDVVGIDGDITFPYNVTVNNVILRDNGTVNGIDISKDLVRLNEHYAGTLHFGDLQTENLIVLNSTDNNSKFDLDTSTNTETKVWEKVTAGKNLTIVKVNDQSWDDFVDSVIWKNKNQHISKNITVKGRVTVKGKMIVDNDETDFKSVFKTDENSNNDHTVSATHTNGKSQNIKTINENNHDESKNKKVRCINRKNLLLKKLKSGKPLKGDVILRGNVFVEDILYTKKKNSQKWSKDAKNIVLKTDSNPSITGHKNFQKLSVAGNLNVNKNINGYDLKNFMTTDSDQEIPGAKTLKEHVIFENIDLNGTWDGINITDLYRNSIRLSSNESLPDLHLIVDDDDDVNLSGDENRSRITTPSLTVTSGYREPRGKISARSDIDESENSLPVFDVENMNFKEIEVLGDLFVEKRISGQNFNDFMNRRVSLRENDNIISGNYSFEAIEVDELLADSINGQSISKPNEEITRNGSPFGLGATKALDIEELYVYGDVKTRNGVSGYDLEKLSQTAFFLRGNSTFNDTLQFEDQVECERLNVKGLVSGVDLNEFFHDAIRLNETKISITAKKVFEKGLNIEGDLDLQLLNGIKVDNLLSKNTNQTVKSKLILKKVQVLDKNDPGSLNINGYLNGVHFNELKHRFNYTDDGIVHWKGDITFDEDITIDSIKVQGDIMGRNFTEFLENVFLQEKKSFSVERVTFDCDVSVYGDISVLGNYNGFNVEDFKRNVALTTDKINVEGNVTFTGKVILNNDLDVYDNVETKTLDGCSIDEWKNNAIHIKDFTKNDLPIPGKKRFSKVTTSGNLKTDLIDDVDLNKVILLNKHQTIQETLDFSKVIVTENIEVGNLVNGLRLKDEYENTLLIDGDQVINSSCNFFGDLIMKRNLKTLRYVNGKSIQNTASLVGNQTFNNNLTFDCITAENEINTSDSLLSGINVEDWNKRAVLKDNVQVVHGEWDVAGNVSFEKPLRGAGVFNGINISRISSGLKAWRKDLFTSRTDKSKSYKRECSDVAMLVNKSRHQFFKLQHFEILQQIPYDKSHISSVHNFQSRSASFLVVSFLSSCRIFIYKWTKITTSFNKIYEQPFSGPVDDWSTLKLNGKTFLVAQSRKDSTTCSSYGAVSLWKFEDFFKKLQHVKELNDFGEILGTNEQLGVFYSFQNGMVSKWRLEEKEGHYTPHQMDTWKREDIGFSRVDGRFTFEVNILTKLAKSTEPKSTGQVFWSTPVLQTEFCLHPQNKFLAVSTKDYPEIRNYTDFVMIYRHNGSLFEKLPALQPFALNWIQLSQQHTFLAFMENNTILQVYELQGGDKGFVNVLSANLPSKDLQTMLLPTDSHWNPIPTLLTYTDDEITLVSAHMAGSVYEGIIPECGIDEGFR